MSFIKHKELISKILNKALTFLAVIMTILSLAQFLGINVQAAAPGPFWTWNGSGVPTKIPDTENFDIINVGGVYFDSNSTFYTALAGNNTYTWGTNNRNQLGTTSSTSVPTIVPALSGLKKVSSGWVSSIGLKNDGTVIFWGDLQTTNTPAIISGLSNIVDIDFDTNNGLALDNTGQVFEISAFLSVPPSLKTGLPSDIVSIASDFNGSRHAIDSSGRVWSWGFNFYGQLGDGTNVDNQTPRVIQGLPQISKLSAGTESLLALDVNGDVWGWGRNYEGQTGQPSSVFEGIPKKIMGLPPIKEVLSGGNSSKAIDFNQKVWEWGANRTGGQSNIPANIPNPANPNLFMLADSGTLQSNGRASVAKRDLVVQAILKIDQTTPVLSVSANNNLTYTINYQNTGPVAAIGVTLTDDLLPDLTFVNCSNSCVNTGQNVTWTLPDIPAGGIGSVTLDVTVSASVPSGKLSNTVLISSSNAESNSAVLALDVIAPATPGLNLTKTANQTNVSENSSFNYTLSYSNTFPTSVDNVIITDTLDPRLTISSLPGQCSNNGQDITCNLGTLAPGDSGTLDIYVNVISGAAGGPLANTAIITSDETDSKAVGSVITVNNPNVNNPNTPLPLQVTKSVNQSSVDPGNSLTYQISIYNPNSESVNYTIKDALDPRLNETYCNNNCSVSNSNVNQALDWNGTIFSNNTLNFQYNVDVASNAAYGDVWNTAIVDYSFVTNSSIQGQTSSSISTLIRDTGQSFNPGNTASPAYTVTKTASVTQANPGDTFDYTITAQSQGYDGNIDILDALDPRLTFISCDFGCNQNGQSITYGDYLSQNSTNTYKITVQVNNPTAGGPLSNTAFITRRSIGYGGSSETKAATAVVQIVTPQNITSLQINKTSSKTVLKPGDSFDYTLNYANIGTNQTTNTTINDILDPRLTFVSCSGGCLQTGQNLSWNIGNSPAADVGSFTVTVTVKNNAAAGILANTAQISSNETNPVAAITYVRIQKPDSLTTIALTKTSNKTSAQPGESITYTLNYANTGNVDLTGGLITDVLDPKLTFASCVGGCTQSGQTITWNIGSIAANSNLNVSVTVNVKNNASTGALTNTATFKTNETPQVTSSVDVNIGAAVYLPLVIAKTSSKTNVSPDSTYTYTINYQNPNSIPVTNTVITDVLDSRLDFVSCSNTCTQSGQNLSWNIGGLAASANGSVVVTVQVKNPAATGILNNTALIESSETVQSSSSIQVTVDPPTALLPFSLSKSTPSNNVNRNSTYTYTINYTNPNIVGVTNTVITDTLDPRLDFVSCSNTCTQSGQNLSWNIGNVVANGSGSVTVTVKVKNLAAYGILSNTAILNSTETSGVSAVSFVSVIPTSSVATPTLTKTQNKTELLRGDALVYTINYSNTSDVNFSNALITDVLNSNLSFVSCSNSCTQTGQTLTWNIGSLPIGATGSITVNVTVKSNAILGLLQNTASISTTESPTVQAFSFGAIIINDPILTSALSISKSASVATASRGDSYTYTLNYSNGLTPVTNTTITDTLDSRLAFVSCSNSCVQSGQNLTWNLGNLAAKASGSVTVIVSVKSNATIGGIDNIAILDSTETIPVNSNKVTVAIIIPDNPTLSISKTVNSNTVAPNGNLTYTVNYSNTANQPVTNTVITDILDSNLSFVSCSNGCTQSGQTITWNIGSLAPNAIGSVTLNVKVSNSALNGLINNTATIDSNETTPSSSDVAVAVIAIIPANISLVNSSSASTLRRGDNFTYTINYANSNIPVTNVNIADLLDSNLSFVSCTAGCTQSGQNISWNLGSLTANQSGSVSLTVQVKPDSILGSINNTATVSSTETTPKTASTKVAVIIDDPTPILNLNVITDKSNVNPGQNINYTVNYSNPSTTNVTNTQIQTTLDPGVSLVTPCNTQCTQVGQVITWNIGNLNAGANGSLSFEVQVQNNATIGLLTNTLNITSAQSIPSNYSSSVAIVPVIAAITPSLSILKTTNQFTVYRGNNVSYTLSYLNGLTAITNATISDTLDSRLSFVSCSNSCSQSGQNITWNIGNLAANQTGSVTLVVQVKNTASLGNIDNTVSVASTQTSSSSSTARIALIINDPTPSLSITKTASPQALEPGSNVTFSLAYSNPSTQIANNTTITDTLDSRLSFVSCSNSCTQSGQNITWSLGNLNPGDSGTVSIVLSTSSSLANSLISNTAQIQANSFNPNNSTASISVAKTPSYSSSTINTTKKVVEGSNLNITKIADKKTARPGDQINFTINYSNDGNESINNVEIQDSLSKYLDLVACSDNCSVSGQILTWKLGALPAGKKGTLVVKTSVKNFPAVLGVNSNTLEKNPADPSVKVDLSESKASIKGENTITESSVAAVAVFDLVAGFQQVLTSTTSEDIVKPILVRTGATSANSSQILYFILELSLLGFVYLSLKDRLQKKS